MSDSPPPAPAVVYFNVFNAMDKSQLDELFEVFKADPVFVQMFLVAFDSSPGLPL